MTMDEANLTLDPKCLWTPSHPEDTQMERFRVGVNDKYNLSLGKALKQEHV